MTLPPVVPGAGGAGAPEAPFRWRLRHRPDVRFGHATGGVAGVLVAAAVIAFVAELADDDATLPGTGFSVALIVAALAAGHVIRGPVRSAAIAATAVAVPLLWFFAVAGDFEGLDRGDARVVLLLSIVSYLALYAAGWTRGRAILLGLALLFAAGWIVFEVADRSIPFGIEQIEGVEPGRDAFEEPRAVFEARDDNTTETAVAEIAIAAVALGVGAALDRRGHMGVATPFVVVGILYGGIGTLTLGLDVGDVYATGAFLAIDGLAVGLTGTSGRRRATSWIGAAVLLTGTVVIVGQATSDVTDDGEAAVFGAFALVAAAVLLVIGILVARAVDEPIDGGEPIASRAAPSPTPGRAAMAGVTPEAPPSTPETATPEPESEANPPAGDGRGAPPPP